MGSVNSTLAESSSVINDQTLEGPFKCKKCDTQFSNEAEKEVHNFTNCGAVEHHYSCQKNACNLKFNSKDDLRKHEETHIVEKPFSCGKCNKKFSDQKEFERHLETHTGALLRQYGCSECDNKFTRLDDLKKHEKSHSKDKLFTCNQCNTQFTKSSGLEKHMTIHKKQFGCSDCDKIFDCKSELEKHEKIHSERKQEMKGKSKPNDKPFECKECGKKFDGFNELKAHESTHSKTEICPEYALGRCEFGASGRVGGTCSFNHPRKCIFQFTQRGCKRRETCSYYHVEKSPSSAKHAARDPTPPRGNQGNRHQSNEMAFLCQSIESFKQEVSNRLKRLEQDNNNNKGRWPQVWS